VTVTHEPVDAWDRIDRWLSDHAPGYRARLRPPAESELLRRVAERSAGAELPPALLSWWGRTDGLDRAPAPESPPPAGHLIPDFYDPCGAAEADERRTIHLQVAQDIVPPPLAAAWEHHTRVRSADPAGTLYPTEAVPVWLPEWLPVAVDGGGGGLFTDLRPGPLHGCVVPFTRTGHDRAPRWPGITEMLTDVADRLQFLDANEAVAMMVGHWTLPRG
jgi:cell wall assembly regulator SMI1